MSEIYQPPSSELEDSHFSLLAELKKEQSYVIGIIAGFFSALGTLLLLEVVGGRVIALTFIIPAFVSGFTIKYLARPFTKKLRFTCAVVAAVPVFLVFFLGMNEAVNIFSIFIPLLNLLICYAISRRSLSYEQERVLYRLRHGRTKNN